MSSAYEIHVMNPNVTAQTLADRALNDAKQKKGAELIERHAAGQLVSWRDSERGIPNPLVRCALFSARNHNVSRQLYGASNPLVFQVIGGGEVKYTGEELRQDDELVWMHLVHLCKEACSEWVSFTPYQFLKAIGWHTTKIYYARLFESFARLAGGLIMVYNPGSDRGITTRLVARFAYAKKPHAKWTVRVFDKDDELLFLFETLYSRVDWDIRLALPEGICSWLHGFLSSHREPFPHKIETLALGAGLTLTPPNNDELTDAQRAKYRMDRLRDLRTKFRTAAATLVTVGFLESFELTRDGVLHVVRVPK